MKEGEKKQENSERDLKEKEETGLYQKNRRDPKRKGTEKGNRNTKFTGGSKSKKRLRNYLSTQNQSDCRFLGDRKMGRGVWTYLSLRPSVCSGKVSVFSGGTWRKAIEILKRGSSLEGPPGGQ